jgi:hypothetical protein
MQYNISDFGAITCDALQTKQIQKAIDTCFVQGGGEVVIPKGIFRTGGIRLRTNVTLRLQSGAILEGSRNPEDYVDYLNDKVEPINLPEKPNETRSVYPFSRWNNAIIRAIDAKNIAIIGEENSYIDGQNCFDEQGEEDYRGPHAINMQNCENINLSGYTIRNSSNWAHAIFNTKNITARNLSVYGGHDGFDIRTCDEVRIENCEFYTGDDCIAGFDNCDVVINNCILDSSCSALRFGGTNVLIKNCKTTAPGRFGFRGNLADKEKEMGKMTNENCRHNMFTPFMYYCDFRADIRKTPGNITIQNCEFENPDSFFKLNFDGKHIWCTNRSLTSITFRNCKATGVSEPILIHGDEKEPLTITLENVEISSRKGHEDVAFIDATNYAKIILQNVTAKNYTNPTIVARTDGEIIVKDSTEFTILK